MVVLYWAGGQLMAAFEVSAKGSVGWRRSGLAVYCCEVSVECL